MNPVAKGEPKATMPSRDPVKVVLPSRDPVKEIPSAPPKTRQFVIREGCGYFPEENVHKREGEVVTLTAKEAKRLIKRGVIDPYIPDDDEDDDE